MEIKLTSDFAAAHVHLDRTLRCLRGNDDVSHEARHAIELLIEAVMVAEHRKPEAEVIAFQRSKTR
jgi:hypothetical protein